MTNPDSAIKTLSPKQARSLTDQYGVSCVSCIILTYDQQLLLQKRGGQFGHFNHCISTFGGRIEDQEKPEKALYRELEEELGATVATTDVTFIDVYTEAVTQFTEVIYGCFWYDRHNSITGCYEGEPLYCQSAQQALELDHLIDDVPWLIKRCCEKDLIE